MCGVRNIRGGFVSCGRAAQPALARCGAAAGAAGWLEAVDGILGRNSFL